jgi:hypothetical protein
MIHDNAAAPLPRFRRDAEADKHGSQDCNETDGAHEGLREIVSAIDEIVSAIELCPQT